MEGITHSLIFILYEIKHGILILKQQVITLYSKIQNIVHLKQIPTASYCILLILCDTEFFHKWLGSPDMDSVRGRGSVFAAA